MCLCGNKMTECNEHEKVKEKYDRRWKGPLNNTGST